ncbi:MAG TPA: hypothetical protein VLD19_09270 [Chitinophagaceae bacterium]|nr:hypothetical protein [Chitinophagaceae bacterium]
MTFKFMQAIGVAIALIGWLIYQMAIKKKSFASIQSDALAILFFIAVWLGIYYLVIH